MFIHVLFEPTNKPNKPNKAINTTVFHINSTYTNPFCNTFFFFFLSITLRASYTCGILNGDVKENMKRILYNEKRLFVSLNVKIESNCMAIINQYY